MQMTVAQRCEDLETIRTQAEVRDPDAESLLQIPLTRQAFCDRNFKLIQRAVDPNWTYEKVIPIAVTGFNPFASCCFYGRGSRFEAWLEDPCGSARSFNENDLLAREVLFMTHDYIHAWSYQVMHALFPDQEVLTVPITEENFEDLVFCHLVSEAAATVGLDYWVLASRGVNEHCPIGSNMRRLTISYSADYMPEYRRFWPKFEVDRPSFFEDIATFYCTGEFVGFALDDIRHSPQLLRWLRHELSYGATQRMYTRSWFAFLAPGVIDLEPEKLDRPISVDTPFRRRLLKELGERLWNKVHTDDTSSPADPPSWVEACNRSAPIDRPADFRFVNLGYTDKKDWKRLTRAESINFSYFLHQYLASIPFAAVPSELLGYVKLLRRECDVELVLQLMRDLPRMEPGPEEPRDVFIAN